MTVATTAKKTRSGINAADAAMFKASYDNRVKWGLGSVESAWQFGKDCNYYSDRYTVAQLATIIGKTTSTIYRHLNFFGAYQRPELATQAAVALDTFNIGTLTIAALGGELPVSGSRSLKGRRYTYECRHCKSHEVARIEIDPETGEPIDREDAAGELPAATRAQAAAAVKAAEAATAKARRTQAAVKAHTKPKAKGVPVLKLLPAETG